MLINIINYAIALIFCVCYAYQIVYIVVPFFVKKRQTQADKLHKYGVLICARNEESVISQLIESVKNQNYPADLVTVFVCADNCTDSTAAVAEAAGAVVFERYNRVSVGKGYALDFLLKAIARNYDISQFDGFFVFDADNVLEPDYIAEMNKSFCQGYRIVTGYRNSKNYGDNWISAGYSLWFLRESQYLNRPRYLLGSSAGVSGTGFLFSRQLIEERGGWKYYLLTEDIEFTIDSVISGEKIGYCESAVLYDEQPTGFKQSVRQRLRWARGYVQVFCDYGAGLLRGIFSRNFRSCYDMAMCIMPAMVLSIASVIVNVTALILNIGQPGAVVQALWSLGQSAANVYLTFLMFGGITLLTEWRKIHASALKKVLYLFTFPIFMFTYIPISVAALFVDVTWKPIAHKQCKTLSEIKRG